MDIKKFFPLLTMKIFFLLFALAALSQAAVFLEDDLKEVEVPFTVCGAHTDPLEVQKMVLDKTPKKGEKNKLTYVQFLSYCFYFRNSI